MGFSKAVLWVLTTNYKAIGFYRHEGFAWDGTEKQELLGTPVTEHRYLKEL